MRESRLLMLALLMVGVVLFALCAMLTVVGGGETKRQRACEAKGGIYFYTRDGDVCLKKDAVIP